MSKKRGHQKGHLARRGGSWVGYWWEEVSDPATGEMSWKRRGRTICPVKGVKKQDAQRLFEDLILSSLNVRSAHPESMGTVREFWEMKFNPSIRARLRPKGYTFYETLIRLHILPTSITHRGAEKTFGDLRMREVDYDAVQSLILNRKDAGYSPRTLLHIKRVLGRMFREAKRVRWYSGDLPIEGLSLGEIRNVRTTKALNWSQAHDVISEMRSPYRELCLTMLIAGLRIGEACGLMWKHINLADDWMILDGESIAPYTMAVRQNWIQAASIVDGKKKRWLWQYGPLKRRTSARDVPLPKILIEMLKEWRELTKFPAPEDPVFANQVTGRPIDHNNARRDVLQPIGARLGMLSGRVNKRGKPTTWLSWHCFRRTANTNAGMAGMTIPERKRVFGWTEDRMVTLYDRTSLEQSREGMERAAEPFEDLAKTKKRGVGND